MGSETKNPPDTVALAGSVSEGSGNALQHPDRVARLGEAKKRSRAMGRYIRQASEGVTPSEGEQLITLAGNVLSCANYLVFHNYYTIDQVRLAKITTCKKHLLCPVCARIRAAKQVNRYLERLAVIREESPGLNLALLTLTVKNGEDLSERFKHLSQSWRKYNDQRRQHLSKGRPSNELCAIDGAVFSYEITNNGNGWHPHIHAVVALNSWIDQERLSKEWQAITGDSSVVDIRLIKGDPVEGFLEVFKYALKFSEMELDLNLQAYFTLKGRRLQGSFGLFHGVKIPEKDTDDLFDDLPYLEMFYRYDKRSSAYTLDSVNNAGEIGGDPAPCARGGANEAASHVHKSTCPHVDLYTNQKSEITNHKSSFLLLRNVTGNSYNVIQNSRINRLAPHYPRPVLNRGAPAAGGG